MTVSDLLEQPCNKSDSINKVVTSFEHLVPNLGQAVRTQLVDGLLADLLQDSRFLRVYIKNIMKYVKLMYLLVVGNA